MSDPTSRSVAAPRVLFMMPNFKSYSQPWIYRMIRALEGEIALVAAGDTHEGEPIGFPTHELFALRRGRRVIGRAPILRPWLYRYDALEGAVRESGADRVLCNFATLAVMYRPVWMRLGLPVFVHVHGYDILPDLRDYSGNLVHPAGYRQSLVELTQEARFIANSDFTAGILREMGAPADHVVRKYLGVPLPRESRKHHCHEEVQISAVGRFVDCKAPLKTVKAFELACQRGLRGRLTLVGDGPMMPEVRAHVAGSSVGHRIELLGACTEAQVNDLLSITDIFTQHNEPGPITGQREAFGVSVLEAMAYGIPAVVTSDGGIPETTEDGVTGFLGEPGNIEQQADFILRLATDPELRKRMGSAGRARVAEKFSDVREKAELREILELG